MTDTTYENESPHTPESRDRDARLVGHDVRGAIVDRLLEPDISAWEDAYSCRARGREAAERIKALIAERAALEAENQRLREALQKCADPHRYHAPCVHCCQTITECGSYIARAALKGDSHD